MQSAAALLGRLSPDQAEAVALRVIAGLGTPDVARILGKSPGAVRVALHRGLRTLADDPAVRALAGFARLTTAAAPTWKVPPTWVSATWVSGTGATATAARQDRPGARGRSGPDQTLWALEEVD